MNLEDGYAKLYAFGVASNPLLLPQWPLRLMPVLLKKVGVTTGSFLDVGCGPGHICNLLTEVGMEGLGVDRSPSMIEYARQLYPDCRFEVGCGEDLGSLPPADLVVMMHDVVNAMPLDEALRMIRELPVSTNGTMVFDITTRRGFERWSDVSYWERDDISIHEHGVFLGDTAVIQVSGFASFAGDGRFERFRTVVTNYYLDPEVIRLAVEKRFKHVRYFDDLGREGWSLGGNKLVFVANGSPEKSLD